MKTIIVDDERFLLNQVTGICRSLTDVEILGSFDSPEDALIFAQQNEIDLALLDVEMPVLNGLELAKRLRVINPDMVIIYISAYEQYMVDAYRIQADYYVLKPCNENDIKSAIDRAKLLGRRIRKKVSIRTFGSFEVFIDGIPLAFPGKKAKEMLALLVDKKGGIVDAVEAYTIIWENKPYTNDQAGLSRRAMKVMQETLDAAGIGNIVISYPRGRALNMDAVDCDYYRFLDGDEDTIKRFPQQYMSDYSWAETTLGSLIIQQEKLLAK